MTGLLTDLYQLTMAAGYFESGKADELATFELFFRHLPRYRNYVLAAGLEQVVEYLQNLHFTGEEIAYLKSLPQFQRVSPAVLRRACESCDSPATCLRCAEGTPIFAGEPFLTVRAPLMEAQIVETFLLATVGFPVADRDQGVPHRGSRGRPRGGRFRHAPRAFAGSGRAGGPRVLHRRLRRNQQHRDWIPLRHSGVRNRGAFLDSVFRHRARSVRSACKNCWAKPPCI